MIAFTSFPAQFSQSSYDQTRHHPDAEDDLMELDTFEDFATQGTKLTCPGESLTSAQAYMRCVPIRYL